MSFIFKICSKNKQARDSLIDCIDSFILDDASSFYALPFINQKEIVGLLLKALDSAFLFDFISEHKDADVMMGHLSCMLIDQDNDSRRTFLESLESNAVSYYADMIDEYFQDRINDRNHSVNTGYHKVIHNLFNPEYLYGTDNKR